MLAQLILRSATYRIEILEDKDPTIGSGSSRAGVDANYTVNDSLALQGKVEFALKDSGDMYVRNHILGVKLILVSLALVNNGLHLTMYTVLTTLISLVVQVFVTAHCLMHYTILKSSMFTKLTASGLKLVTVFQKIMQSKS